jgi:hypothetical protein
MIIRLPDDADAREGAVSKLKKKPPLDEHYDEIIEPPVDVFWPTGELAAVYRDNAGLFSREERDALLSIKYADGHGKRSGGLPTSSFTFSAQPGAQPGRNQEARHRSKLDREYPALYEALARNGRELVDWRPEPFAAQGGWIEAKVLRDWQMGGGGPFTSGIVNKNNVLPYHRDTANVPHSWNAMTVLRKDTDGGLLVIPAWRLAFECGDGHVLLMDQHRTMHGVTKIERIRTGGYRLSVVYYCLADLEGGVGLADDRARAQRKQTERDDRQGGLV